MKQKIAGWRFLLCVGLAFVGRATLAETGEPCGSLPLLSRYVRAGIAARTDEGDVTLSLTADRHSADCGAPDCYGTKILLTLRLRAEDGDCVVQGGQAQAVDFFGLGCEDFASTSKAAAYDYEVESRAADLSDPALRQLTLRDVSAGNAVVLLPQNFFFFEGVTQNGVLHTYLDPSGTEDTGCCWGASSAMLSSGSLSEPPAFQDDEE
jgi:hypothetical protein